MTTDNSAGPLNGNLLRIVNRNIFSVNSIASGSSTAYALPALSVTASGNIALGTTTSQYILSSYSASAPQLALSAGSNIPQWTFRNAGSNLYFSTTTVAGTSTTTLPALVIVGSTGNIGIGTSTATLGPLTMRSGAYVTTGGTWTNASDRNLKENFTDLDPTDILTKITQLPITQWNYKTESASTTHIGPTAQDFYSLFHTGNSDTSISTIDPAGVALVGVKALSVKIDTLSDSLSDTLLSKVSAIFSWFYDDIFHIQNNVCVDDVCVTKEQFKQILLNNGGLSPQVNSGSSDSQDSITDDVPDDTATTTPPDTEEDISEE